MSEASRKAWADPAVRARMSEVRRKAWADRDYGELICAACKQGNCLCCDGGECRCPCTLELDIPHRSQKRVRA